MKRDVDRLNGGQYDVLVIGGGINGAAIANLAAFNGLNVALIEKGEFASGTSSKSSKLLHGGLRYLENLEFDLVAESLKERTIQLNSAPKLTRPLGFIIPFYKSDSRPAWVMRLGVWLYDLLSGKYKIHPHRKLTKEEVLHLSPHINDKELLGGVMYFDAQMDDKGLCLANVNAAVNKGAIAIDNCEVKEFIKENGKSVGIKALDKINNRTIKVRAHTIISAAGPWTNRVLQLEGGSVPSKVRTTKGVHVVYKEKLCEHAILLQHTKDNRIFFIMPWNENTLIGTTDTDYDGDPDKLTVEPEDVDYLLNALQDTFVYQPISRDKIVETFAGLRPLVHQKGSPSKVSRKHVIEQSFSGIIYVMGGKYTTYRKIAEDSLKLFIKKDLRESQPEYPL